METIDTYIERLNAVKERQDEWFKWRDEGRFGSIFRVPNHDSHICGTDGRLLVAIDVGIDAAAKYPEVSVPNGVADVVFAAQYGTHELITTVQVLRKWAAPVESTQCQKCGGAGTTECMCDADDDCIVCDGDGRLLCTSCSPKACRPGVLGGSVVDRGYLWLMLKGVPDGPLRMQRNKDLAEPATKIEDDNIRFVLRFEADGWKAVLMPMRTAKDKLPRFACKLMTRELVVA